MKKKAECVPGGNPFSALPLGVLAGVIVSRERICKAYGSSASVIEEVYVSRWCILPRSSEAVAQYGFRSVQGVSRMKSGCRVRSAELQRTSVLGNAGWDRSTADTAHPVWHMDVQERMPVDDYFVSQHVGDHD